MPIVTIGSGCILDLFRAPQSTNMMNKADLVERVADIIGPQVSKRECSLLIDALLAVVKDALIQGEGVQLRGFGTFKVRHRKARKARNLNTGSSVTIAPRTVPVFCPSKLLRDQLDRGCDA